MEENEKQITNSNMLTMMLMTIMLLGQFFTLNQMQH